MKPTNYKGIAPSLLVEQVRNTADWFMGNETAGAVRALKAGVALGEAWQTPRARGEYLSALLAAHYVTVATFVPTNVDTHIRHHHWWSVANEDELRSSLDRIDEAASWDPRLVSNRTVEIGGEVLSGHDGEWFAVRAGALGRALAMGDKPSIDKLVAQLDAEVEREASMYRVVKAAKGRELDLLRVATLITHNLGDLSRIVDQWKTKSEHADLHARYVRLTHENGARHGGLFIEVGNVNKEFMADENHRFLPLRKPKPLRKHKDFVIPFGPLFDAWGALLATSPALLPRDRGEVVEALLSGHEQQPTCQAYLRALTGFHHAHRGGLDRLVADELPAKAKRAISAGPIRSAISLSTEAFEARLAKKVQAFVR